MIDEDLREWRQTFRDAEIGPHYLGWLHFAFTTIGSLVAIGFAVSRIHGMTLFEWALLPAFFLIANLGEYLGHRGPMHHRKDGLGLVFKRHTLQHHHFFTSDAMECESPRDFKIMLFPPVMLLFFIGGMTLPIGALFYVLVSHNAGWLFGVVGVSYFLTYEWLHFLYHVPKDSALGRVPFVGALRRHHQAHHDPQLMTQWNFNITFPLCDWLFGTVYHRRN